MKIMASRMCVHLINRTPSGQESDEMESDLITAILEAFRSGRDLIGLSTFLHHFLPLGDSKESPFFCIH